MKTNFYFIKQDALNFLKNNIDTNIENGLYDAPNQDWVNASYEGNGFDIIKKNISEFSLDASLPNVVNMKSLHHAMKDLTPSEAADERIWAGLAHTTYWKYVQEYIQHHSRGSKETAIKNHFFLESRSGLKRSLLINSLSSLWWAGQYIYDSHNPSNPYHYSVLFERTFSHKLINTFTSSVMNNESVRFLVFDATLELINNGFEITPDTMSYIVKHINYIGGAKLIDMTPMHELIKLTNDYIYNNLEDLVSAEHNQEGKE